jgi:amino acid adenylation domain-containing protein
VNVLVSESKIEVALHYWTSCLSQTQATLVADTFQQAITELTSKSEMTVGNLDLFGPSNRRQIEAWNAHLSQPVARCAHELIQERNLKQLEALAVHAWDGDFTYQMLETLATNLAVHLQHRHQVGPEVFVPVYFEKSRWVVVAVLAILKAGGAFVLLDPIHPMGRLQDICQDLSAGTVITSERNSTRAKDLGLEIVAIGTHQCSWDDSDSAPQKVVATATPENPLYAVFTSGSTGKPKGAVMSHQSWCTSAEANRIGLSLDETSRVLQFASFAFDISIADILLTLLAGGCVCIPSDEDRQSNLIRTVNRLDVNWACLTPSVTRIIEPQAVPCLKKLVLCGEAIPPAEIAKWSPTVHLLNLYGPAECAILTTLHRTVRNEKDPNNVGLPTSAVCWIVDPEDPERRLPVGCVGELIVESPIVSRGYLNEPAKTAASFIKSPSWLTQIRPSTTASRFYKTGDMVQYAGGDGSIRYIARKDTQVKLRGQRVELGEVEYHLRRCFPAAEDAITEVHRPTDKSRPAALIAFIFRTSGHSQPQSDQGTSPFDTPDDEFREGIVTTVSQLDDVLPIFMVPTVFIPLRYIPLTKTGKTDRRRLREAVSGLTGEELDLFMSTSCAKSAPQTESERQFEKCFKSIFKLGLVGREDNFFRLGGDSIIAMQLIPMVREAGFQISMGDVFKHPRLCDLAAASQPVNNESALSIRPFSLLSEEVSGDTLVKQAAEHCGVEPEEIEDIYPCTALQEGLIALAAKSPGRFVVTFEYQLREEVDIERFQSAWRVTAVANPILRTRMAQFEQLEGTYQVVTQSPLHVRSFDNAEHHSACLQSLGEQMSLGHELAVLTVVQPTPTASKGATFYLTIHHALYDGWSLPLLWDQVLAAYRGNRLLARPFNRFIQHVLSQDGMGRFWLSELANLHAPVWPALPSPRYTPIPVSSFHKSIILDHVSTEFTISTMIRLAWAIVMSYYTDSEDVVYGLTLNGRSAPLPGIGELAGPTFATIPLRTQLRFQDTVHAALTAVQDKTAAMIPFQQYGLHKIRRLSPDAAQACNFQCHLGIQPPSDLDSNTLYERVSSGHKDYAAFGDCAFMIVCHLEKDDQSRVSVMVNYDNKVISSVDGQRLVNQFSHILQQLPTTLDLPLNQLELLCPEDKHQLSLWNSHLPVSCGRSLHDLILSTAVTAPNSQAISAWDGEFSFLELDQLSHELSQQLQRRGVGKGSLVPICFHRSKWVVVAMLAVLRAGGACVPLDPSHPPDRICSILCQTKSELALVSPSSCAILAECDVRVLVVPLETLVQKPTTPSPLPNVDPHDLAFVIFTSGSTGQPKGILMEHINLCTSISHHSTPCNITRGTRGLHFCSYAFDASLYEVFTVLAAGGCVCIPSEEERLNDLTGFIARHHVNAATFTPSLLNRLLQPDLVPGLKTINLGGEAVTQDVVDTWASKVTLINGYGPAEATICAAEQILPATWTTGQIGPITGGRGWITLPSDPSRLTMLGAVGELLIEGPVVSRGYLDNPKQTAKGYLDTPRWLTEFRAGDKPGRLYRTGDLVSYMPDGSIRFMGRKDTQVKLRGQRVELAEVEHHVRPVFPEPSEIVAEMVIHVDEIAPFLVAFICCQETQVRKTASEESIFLAPDAVFLERAQTAKAHLMAALPTYMIPALFLQLARIPRTSSGKLDRRQLRDLAAAIPQERMQAFRTQSSTKVLPQNKHEELLLDLWATALQVPRDRIGTNDDFFHLGGDSISAMKLASLARRRGIDLSVSDIFRNPVLAILASNMQELQQPIEEELYHAGSLVGIDDIGAFLAGSPNSKPWPFHTHEVDDILPITEFQNTFLADRTLRYIRLSVPRKVDPGQVEAACRALVHHYSMLRTVFVSHQGRSLAVVLRNLNIEMPRLHCDATDLESFADSVCEQDFAKGVTDGAAYFQPYLVLSPNEDSPHLLILRTTHAHYDGQSFPWILDDLVATCENQPLRSDIPPYALYLRYRERQKTPQAFQFWQEYLQGAQMPDLAKVVEVYPSSPYCAEADCRMLTPRCDIPLPSPPEGITMASLVKTAWAVVLARVTGQRDVIFGQILNGRHAPMAQIEAVSGPCVTISPIRITLPSSGAVSDLLHQVQSQYAHVMPFADLDFQDIRQHATGWGPDTQLNSVVTHQNGGGSPTVPLDGVECPWRAVDHGVTSHFNVVTFPWQGTLVVQLAVPSSRISVKGAQYLLDQFCEALADVADGGDIVL